MPSSISWGSCARRCPSVPTSDISDNNFSSESSNREDLQVEKKSGKKSMKKKEVKVTSDAPSNHYRLDLYADGLQKSKPTFLKWDEAFREKANHLCNTRNNSPYKKVEVLFAYFETRDLKLSAEIKPLKKIFEKSYNYKVHTYEIPDEQPANALTKRVSKFVKVAADDTLLIFYFSGHGCRKNGGLHWSGTSSARSPSLPVGGVQTILEQCPADTLLVYDCCYAAGTNVGMQSTNMRYSKELVGASGFETSTNANCQESFVNAFTKVLKETADHKKRKHRRISIPQLENELIAELQNSHGDPSCPVHTSLFPNKHGRQIILAPLQKVSKETTQRKAKAPGNIFTMSLELKHGTPDEAFEEWFLSMLRQAPPNVQGVHFHEPSHDGEKSKSIPTTLGKTKRRMRHSASLTNSHTTAGSNEEKRVGASG